MKKYFDPNFGYLEDVVLPKIDKDEICGELTSLDEKLVQSTDVTKAAEAIDDFFAYEDQVSTAFSLVYIRHTIDTRNEEYSKLFDYLNEIMPAIQERADSFRKHLLNSPLRMELEEKYGKLLFDEMALSAKTFSPAIMDDLVEENKLSSEYVRLTGSAEVEYRGEKMSLSQLGRYTSDRDRETRKEASALVTGFYADHEKEIGEIYDKMVHVRTRIAQKLGYENFLPLGYARMGRLDWDSKDADDYREKIKKYIVPLSNRIYAEQKERLGFGKDTRFYDYNVFYKSGNATPKGTPDELIAAAKEMYRQMSPIASEKFDFMVEHHCMDILAKPGKAGGGYMDYLPALKTSFIFSNFNGTSGDVDVLTHEFGHSLQGFLGGEEKIPAYRNPGMECCEMHSMSMEFLTYPYMSLFFKEDTDKYLYEHLASAITFIPYGCIVDAFQTYCYRHPDITPDERMTYWRSLEKEYLPHRQYPDNAFLEKGGYWMRQGHIFENPLYYLDYTIAQIVSLEFFLDSLEDPKKAFDKYLAFCKLGGKYSFRKLLKVANIANPMDGDTLKNVSEKIVKYLDRFDLKKIDR